MPMKKPPRPGRYLKDACLDPLALSVTGGKVLGVARHTLSRVINSQAGISPEMAIRLEKAGWSDADQLLRVQAAYDLRSAASSGQYPGHALPAATCRNLPQLAATCPQHECSVLPRT